MVLIISHEKLTNAIKLNPALMHGNSYEKVHKEVIKLTVSRNIRDFSRHTDDDKPQDVIKGIESML